jgi:predicted  nucleic acid-binding Zn-ribbon protein
LPDGTKDVTGVPKKYAGTNYRDLPIVNKSTNKQRSGVMSKWSENRMNELRGELGAADEQIDKRRGEIMRVKIEADERTGEIQKEVNRLQDIRRNIVIAITLISEQIRAESLEAKTESTPEVPAPVEAEAAHNYVP